MSFMNTAKNTARFVGSSVQGFGRRIGSEAQGLRREVGSAAGGWFSWSQKNKYATILILVTVMIVISIYLQTKTSASKGYANMNIRYGSDGFASTDNEMEFAPPQAAADKSVTGSRGTQGSVIW